MPKIGAILATGENSILTTLWLTSAGQRGGCRLRGHFVLCGTSGPTSEIKLYVGGMLTWPIQDDQMNMTANF